MGNPQKIFLTLFFLTISYPMISQNIDTMPEQVHDTITSSVDTASIWITDEHLPKETDGKMLVTSPMFRPDPKKAVVYSLMFPGLGQIYNKKYWKLPIIYAGFVGLTYAVTWNGRYYQDYLKAFKDISDDDATTNSWHNFLSPTIDPSTLSEAQISNYTTVFRNRKNYYRRYRDLSIIGMVGLYALCAIDAYIDAQLFDFNVSDDVSMRVQPAVIPSVNSNNISSNSLGVHCNITF